MCVCACVCAEPARGHSSLGVQALLRLEPRAGWQPPEGELMAQVKSLGLPFFSGLELIGSGPSLIRESNLPIEMLICVCVPGPHTPEACHLPLCPSLSPKMLILPKTTSAETARTVVDQVSLHFGAWSL